MTIAVWVAIAWACVSLITALGGRINTGHVLPDAGVVILVFLALRRSAIEVSIAALLLGYLTGRQALAPMGLHEAALVVTVLAVYFAAGNIAGSGTFFFALASGGAVMLYHLLIVIIAWLFGGEAAFTGWLTASLLPVGLLTVLLALVGHKPMLRLEKKLVPEQREALSWR